MLRRLTLAVTLCTLPEIAAADRVKVAVVPSIAVNLDAARVDALSQDLAEALTTELDVEALGGLEVRRRLPVEGIPAACVANQACIAEVAKRLDAQQLLFVVMIDTGSGGAIQVDSTWIDPATHQSASRPAIDIAAVAGAKARFAAAAHQFLPDAPIRPKPKAGSLGQISTPVPRHLTMPTYVTMGAAAVSLGAGISLGLVARGKYKDCEALAATGTACTQSRQGSIRTLALIADAGWGLAIGGTVAAAILYATSSEASHVIVEPTPGGVAVSAFGSF